MAFLGALGGILGGAGSIFGGLFGANASNQASQQYIKALQQAQQWLQGQEQQGLSNYAPFLSAGQGATNQLSSLLSTPGQGLLTPWGQTFTAPTAQQAEQTPGYQFQLQQGLNALQNSQAGQGGLLTGRSLKDLNSFAQGLASENYQNTFNNALTQYQTAYSTFNNNQTNAYNRLLGLSNEGLQAAGGEGQLISGIGGDIASLLGQQGAAKAQGTIGAANSYSSILPGLGNSLFGLSGLFGNNAGSSAPNAGFSDLSSLGMISPLPTFSQPSSSGLSYSG